MLSKTDDNRPRPNDDCQDGSGRPVTGISEAAATSAARKIAPVAAGRTTDQSGAAKRLVIKIAAHSAKPIHGTVSSPSLSMLARMLAATAVARIAATIPILRQLSS